MKMNYYYLYNLIHHADFGFRVVAAEGEFKSNNETLT